MQYNIADIALIGLFLASSAVLFFQVIMPFFAKKAECEVAHVEQQVTNLDVVPNRPLEKPLNGLTFKDMDRPSSRVFHAEAAPRVREYTDVEKQIYSYSKRRRARLNSLYLQSRNQE